MSRKILCNKSTILTGVKKNIIRILIVLFVIVIIYIKRERWIGISSNKIEQDARITQSVSNEWKAIHKSFEDIYVVAFYSDDWKHMTCSIYSKKNQRFHRYQFKSGGSFATIEGGPLDHVVRVLYEEYELLISDNQDHITSIHVNNSQVYEVNESEPFIVILPHMIVPSDAIELYDGKGNLIE